MDNPHHQLTRILPIEVGTFVVISLIFFFALISGDSNGIGVFQQPESNLMAPILIGIIFNGLLMYLIIFRIILPHFLKQRYLKMVSLLLGIMTICVIIKTSAHAALIYLAYPSLKSYTLYDLAEENLYFVMPIGVFAILYGLAKVSIFKRIHGTSADRTINLTSGKKVYRFKVSKIKYIKSEGNYVKVITEDESPLLYTSLDNLEKILPSEIFIRIHRSYIISINNITKIETGSITVDSKSLPVGQKYAESVREKLAKMSSE